MSVTASRLGVVTTRQIQAALDRFHLGTVLRISPVPLGMGGQTLFISSTGGEYVFRGNQLFSGQLDKERFVTHLLHTQTSVPAPYPYVVDDSIEIFAYSYAIMPRLPGISIPDVAAVPSGHEQDAVARALARGLAALHQASWPTPGEYDASAGTIKPLTVSYAEWVTTRVREAVARIVQEDPAVTRADQVWVETILKEAQLALREPFQPTFVMHDFHNNNLVFAHRAGTWEVSGVFDLSEAYIGDGDADLARPTRMLLLLKPELARAFLRAYLERLPASPGFLERYPVYVLDDLLVSWTFARRRGWRYPDRSLRDVCEPFTSAARSLLM